MSYLPLSGADVCKLMNLPSDMASNAVFDGHKHAVMAMLDDYVVEEAMEDAEEYELPEGDNPVIDSEYYHNMRLGYAYLMLAQTASLLNLKTIGEGIVKSVGIDNAATELLTGNEIEQFENAMEKKGLRVMWAFLSEAGMARIRELEPKPKGFKCAVI